MPLFLRLGRVVPMEMTEKEQAYRQRLEKRFAGYNVDIILQVMSDLRHFPALEKRAAMLDEEIQHLEYLLQEKAAAPISHTDRIGHAIGQNTSQEELLLFSKEELFNKYLEKRRQRLDIRLQLKALKNALQGLKPVDRHIIERRFLQGLSWDKVAACTGYSNHNCRVRADKALKEMALVAYGHGVALLDFKYPFDVE